jgi:hypothetical protein
MKTLLPFPRMAIEALQCYVPKHVLCMQWFASLSVQVVVELI